MHPYAGWRPQIKPGPPHAIEKNPDGLLSNGLQSLLLFNNGVIPSSIQDYAVPGRVLLPNGSGFIQSSSQYGGLAFSTPDTASNIGLLYSAAINAATNVWTFSTLMKFNGVSSAGGGTHILVMNSAFSLGITIDATTGDIQSNSSVPRWTNKAVTSFTTWTRVGISTNGVNGRLFLNGAFDSTQTCNISIDLLVLFSGVPYPIADFFWWTRALSDSEMMTHFLDPYGTTMRPRFGAMRQATGPKRIAPLPIQIWDH